MSMDVSIGIREFQHFLYCPHRWGIIQIEQQWNENSNVSKANIMHQNVHRFGEAVKQDVKQLYSLPVFWDEKNIYGMLDYAEIDGNIFRIVEYKPTKQHDIPLIADVMQVYVQSLCIQNIYHDKYNIQCYFYYDNVRKRMKINFNKYDNLYLQMEATRQNILFNKLHGIIPPVVYGSQCNGCSLKDVCFPKIKESQLWNRINKSLKII